MVTAVSPGVDTITCTVTNGCGVSITTAVVTITGTVIAGTISGASSVCPGAPVTLTDATSGGVWSSGNTASATVSATGLVTGIAAGTAMISYTVTGSCGAATATFPVTVSATALTAGSITGVSSLCVGSFTIFTDAAGGGGWTASNGNATITSVGVVTGIALGTDTISYTVSNSCGTATATQVVTVSGSITAGSITGQAMCASGSLLRSQMQPAAAYGAAAMQMPQ